MKQVKGITSLSFGDIACNATLFGILSYNTSYTSPTDTMAMSIAGFGIIISILYAIQLILMKRSYYRHHTISAGAKIPLHICRIIQLLYSIMEAGLLSTGVYFTFRDRNIVHNNDYKGMLIMAALLVTVVMNLIIFFKGWRLLKLVKRPYIEEVMASFD
ncbi:MAG: hypothetical protein BGO55_07065 [Sphingobacteriales bacterium 50-39]|nr:hypothetical protein [Sphingobacteriales bacterium]OJW53011.1 MAG: hypothetical protein BGO55_07065 [Sphingobacteriales bacterium 50-39]